jgi:hypothetical protein
MVRGKMKTSRSYFMERVAGSKFHLVASCIAIPVIVLTRNVCAQHQNLLAEAFSLT